MTGLARTIHTRAGTGRRPGRLSELSLFLFLYIPSVLRYTFTVFEQTAVFWSPQRGYVMLKIKEYARAESLEQAYEWNQKRSSCVLGGMLWLKMSERNVGKAIDLSGLGLDQIREDGEEFRIGCMATLRQMERHEGLNRYTEGAVRAALAGIVGVQFRNLATAGGSVFGRFGFSDVLTVLLAMDTSVILYHRGEIPLEEFMAGKRDRDILTEIRIRKQPGFHMVYQAHRNSRTDFPVLNAAAALDAAGGKLVFGARPLPAMALPLEEKLTKQLRGGNLTEKEAAEAAERTAEQVPVGGNMRGSAGYRRHLTRVLGRRSLLELQKLAAAEKGGTVS